MFHAETFMAYRRADPFDHPGYCMIVRVIDVHGGIANITSGPATVCNVPVSDLLPIGDSAIRSIFGLRPFAEVWPANQPRSGVPADQVFCFLPDFYKRPGIEWEIKIASETR